MKYPEASPVLKETSDKATTSVNGPGTILSYVSKANTQIKALFDLKFIVNELQEVRCQFLIAHLQGGANLPFAPGGTAVTDLPSVTAIIFIIIK